MTPDQRGRQKNNGVRNILIIITLIIGLFVFLDGRMDKKVESHPSVIALEKQYENVEKSLDRIEEKVDKLLEADR